MVERSILPLLAGSLLSSCGCNETGLEGDTCTDVILDLPTDRPDDWMPEPGTGNLTPLGDPAFYRPDVALEVGPFEWGYLPVAYSGEVYTILLREPSDIAAYRLVPRGSVLTTVWFDDLSDASVPSICWTGEVFMASFPIRGEANRVLAFTEAGEHTGTEAVGTIADGDPCDWMSGDPNHVMCPSSGPLIVDFMQPGWMPSIDTLYLLSPDGSPAGGSLEVDLPQPAANEMKPACSAVGDIAACLAYSTPAPSNVFFFDRDGNVWESATLPESSQFYGCAIVDVGDAAAVVWATRPPGLETLYIGYCLMDLSGDFIIPPVTSDFPVTDARTGLSAASSGRDILVAGPPIDERGAEPGTRLYLLDLTGRIMDHIRLDPDSDWHFSPVVFWEGDAYAVLWSKDGGIMYRRYLVE